MKKNYFFRKFPLYGLLSFLVPVLILGGVYILMGVFPFGGKTILVKDILGQYADFYSAYRRVILGVESPFYSWSKSLGGNFWGIFSYYLASPFSLLTLILPERYLPESFVLMTLAKTGCSGLTFAVYLSLSRGAKGPQRLVFSLPYALMSYALVYSSNIMWLDGIVFLPLIVLGIEWIVQGKSFLIYYLSLAVMLIANYYIGYMVCLFSALYFLYYSSLLFSRQQWKGALSSLGKFIFTSFLSAGSAAFMLLPTYYSLMAGKLEIQNPLFYIQQTSVFPDGLLKLMFGSFDSAMGDLPNIYCGLAILFLAFLFFVSRSVSLRQKICAGLFLLFLGLSFNTSILDWIWHGFQPPVWYFYRYSFVFCFLLVTLAFTAYQNINKVTRKELSISLGISMILILFALARQANFLSNQMITVSLILFCIYFLALLFTQRYSRRAVYILLVFVMAEAGGHTLYFIQQINEELKYSDRVTYSRFSDQVIPVIRKIQQTDNGFFRLEKTFSRSRNDALGLGYKGLAHDSSSFDRASLQVFKDLGYLQGGFQITNTGSTILSDSLFGIKYLLSLNQELPAYQEMARESGKLGEIISYQNPYALPLGFEVDPILESQKYPGGSPLLWQNRLLGAMTGNPEAVYFKAVKNIDIQTENVTVQTEQGAIQYTIQDSQKEAWIKYTLHPEMEGPLYLYLPALDETKVEVVYGGASLGFYGQGIEKNNIVSLGQVNQGQSVMVGLKMMSDRVTLSPDTPFFSLDMVSFKQAIDRLKEKPFIITTCDDTHVTGHIDASRESSLLMTSIPYDEGWSVRVDGKPALKQKLINAFIGVPLSAGQHEIELSYLLPGLVPGLMVTIFSLCLTIFTLLITKKRASDKNRMP